ncbi:hypothetical protein K461DRAFT_246732 [Myriangium duriaei CBS 260.36]|uniref:Tyrosine--tRNA ligase n=1 Tax=Myriangium duriaei CBS 260.36 TaxID=1168546 RepID=A0A9P4MCY9_9PEZI|nr:hypothetical protein K461DRAFT_246732 [Myriangium duriaei CBS 260.36]
MKRTRPASCRRVWPQLHGSRRYASDASEGAWKRFFAVQIKTESPAWQEHATLISARQAKHAIEVLEERGLIKAIAGDRTQLIQRLTSQRIAAYSGIDPTAPSLHVGHLIPLNVLFWLYACGHTVTSLVGDTTARIGDPTDRLTARNARSKGEEQDSSSRMKDQLKMIWRNVDKTLETRKQMLNQDDYGFRQDLGPRRSIDSNSRWLRNMTLWDFLRTMGRSAKMGAMLSRDTVKNRLEKGESMTMAEFTYPLLQAMDWFHMYAERGVEVQIGGSDQYGNIVAGIDYINYMQRAHPEECTIGKPGLNAKSRSPYGITTPLLETSSGQKFGKSAGNAVWLNADMTSPFDLYGHLLKTSDDDVERFLKLLTIAPLDWIEKAMVEQRKDPSKRPAQHLLAQEICRIAHGEAIMEKTREEHQRSRGLSVDNFASGAGDKTSTVEGVIPSTGSKARHYLPHSLVATTQLVSIAPLVGATGSVKEAKILREQGGLYVATKSNDDPNKLEFKQANSLVTREDWLIDGKYLVMRAGKWRTYPIEVLSDEAFEERKLQVKGRPDWKTQVKEALERKAAHTQKP